MGNLTLEEQNLFNSFEHGEWVSNPNFLEREKQLQEYANNTLQLKQNIEITLSPIESHPQVEIKP